MTTSIVKRDLPDMQKLLNGGTLVGQTSLRLSPGTTRDQWVNVARKISAVGYGYWWWVADLAEYARHNFEKPDDLLQELRAASGSNMKYLIMLADASKKYPVRDRMPGLSITHHLYVMRMPHGERQRLLKRAAKRGWSVRFLLDRITPPEKRTFTIIFKAPARLKNDKEFAAAVKNFASKWDCGVKMWTGHRKTQTRRTMLVAKLAATA